MELSPPPRRTRPTSRLALAVAALAAAGTFAAAVAVTGLPAAPAADAASSAATTSQVLQDPATGERVVVDTVYIVTPAPAAALPQQPPGGGEPEGDGHEGGDD
jgi:hypothetical protein